MFYPLSKIPQCRKNRFVTPQYANVAVNMDKHPVKFTFTKIINLKLRFATYVKFYLPEDNTEILTGQTSVRDRQMQRVSCQRRLVHRVPM